KRELGCAAFSLLSGVQGRPCQSVRRAGGSLVSPSHHGSPVSVMATLVKIEFLPSVARAFELVCLPVPGAKPKKPASGLIAQRRPSGPKRIQQMSSPTVKTLNWSPRLGTSIARLVLPQAEGKAAAT